jgi:hypothetical protein
MTRCSSELDVVNETAGMGCSAQFEDRGRMLLFASLTVKWGFALIFAGRHGARDFLNRSATKLLFDAMG